VPVPAKLSLVTLGVADVERATAFYRALGWELSNASVPGEVSFFKTTGGILALFGHDALAADAAVEPVPAPAFRGVSLAVNVGGRDEVDSALDAAVAAGARLVKAPGPTDWGGYLGYFADPDGHLWEVTHNPGWPLDEADHPVLP
jgi:uncharacterized protein